MHQSTTLTGAGAAVQPCLRGLAPLSQRSLAP